MSKAKVPAYPSGLRAWGVYYERNCMARDKRDKELAEDLKKMEKDKKHPFEIIVFCVAELMGRKGLHECRRVIENLEIPASRAKEEIADQVSKLIGSLQNTPSRPIQPIAVATVTPKKEEESDVKEENIDSPKAVDGEGIESDETGGEGQGEREDDGGENKVEENPNDNGVSSPDGGSESSVEEDEKEVKTEQDINYDIGEEEKANVE